jgi:hypothetical protein
MSLFVKLTQLERVSSYKTCEITRERREVSSFIETPTWINADNMLLFARYGDRTRIELRSEFANGSKYTDVKETEDEIFNAEKREM